MKALPLFAIVLVLSGCRMPSAQPSPATLGAGFRHSLYGPDFDPGPAYWASVGERMSDRFEGSQPVSIWIIGEIQGDQAFLNFPGASDDPKILFGETDDNEAALNYFDRVGIKTWLQVEPGKADVLELIDLILDRYGKHPCVVGFGVDIEWFRSNGEEALGQPVSDELAAAWVRAVRAHDPDYALFLKHWDPAWMPASYRDGILFVDDSQQFGSMQDMVAEFTAWGQTFSPAPVAFQYGYPDDRNWWSTLQDPPGDIGRAILQAVPNTRALFWVDFTALDVFPPTP